MNINNKFILAAFLQLTALSFGAQAVPVAVTDGSRQLLGFNGIDIAGVTWNVTFVDDSFDNIFGSASALDFTSQEQAFDASMALLRTYAMPQHTLYDQQPVTTHGISNPVGAIATPYELQGNDVITSIYINGPDGEAERRQDFNVDDNLMLEFDFVYADWALASPVPVPAAVWLMGTGLLGLVGYSRSRTQAAA